MRVHELDVLDRVTGGHCSVDQNQTGNHVADSTRTSREIDDPNVLNTTIMQAEEVVVERDNNIAALTASDQIRFVWCDKQARSGWSECFDPSPL